MGFCPVLVLTPPPTPDPGFLHLGEDQSSFPQHFSIGLSSSAVTWAGEQWFVFAWSLPPPLVF